MIETLAVIYEIRTAAGTWAAKSHDGKIIACDLRALQGLYVRSLAEYCVEKGFALFVRQSDGWAKVVPVTPIQALPVNR